jgi:hypothetical protein
MQLINNGLVFIINTAPDLVILLNRILIEVIYV